MLRPSNSQLDTEYEKTDLDLPAFIAIRISCNTEKAPDCFQTAGKTVQKEVKLEPFQEIMVYERVKLYVKEGPSIRL